LHYLPLVTFLPNGSMQGVAPYVINGIPVTAGEPALHKLYARRYATAPPNNNYTHAKCLFLTVSMGSPEAMEQFNANEIATDTDGYQYFVDGWSRPIYFLRWAPGCSQLHKTGTVADGYSSIQTGDPVADHDPFDSRNVDAPPLAAPGGCQLFPLIVSFASDSGARGHSDGSYGNLNMGKSVLFYDSKNKTLPVSICDSQSPYADVGAPEATYGAGAKGNITNHHIEQR
jgi:hypothetical protein